MNKHNCIWKIILCYLAYSSMVGGGFSPQNKIHVYMCISKNTQHVSRSYIDSHGRKESQESA